MISVKIRNDNRLPEVERRLSARQSGSNRYTVNYMFSAPLCLRLHEYMHVIVCERNLKGRSVRLVVRGPHRRADEQAGPVVKIRKLRACDQATCDCDHAGLMAV
jgi:hypothetical protein